MLSKKILLPAVTVIVIGTAVAFGTTQVHAQTNTNPFSGFVQAISQKFGLDQSQVQSFVSQYAQQHKQDMQQKMQEREHARLDQLVKDGKITSSQEQAILNELAALKSKYSPDSFKNLTPAERKQRFQDMQNELKSWAQSQGINLSYVLPFGMGRMMVFHKFFGSPQVTTPTPTP